MENTWDPSSDQREVHGGRRWRRGKHAPRSFTPTKIAPNPHFETDASVRCVQLQISVVNGSSVPHQSEWGFFFPHTPEALVTPAIRKALKQPLTYTDTHTHLHSKMKLSTGTMCEQHRSQAEPSVDHPESHHVSCCLFCRSTSLLLSNTRPIMQYSTHLRRTRRCISSTNIIRLIGHCCVPNTKCVVL